MHKKYQLSIIILLLSITAKGQIIFQEPIGGFQNETGNCINLTNDGGYIIAGSTRSYGVGKADAYLVKIDSIGTIEWTKTYGGPENECANSVIQTNDGGYLAVGYYNGHNFSGFEFTRDIYLIKTDQLGETLWTKNLGDGEWDEALSVQNTFDSAFIVCGIYNKVIGGYYERRAFLIKIDNNGNILFSKNYGDLFDWATSVQQTFDGGFIFTGRTCGWTYFYGDISLVKTDLNGNKIWSKRFGFSDRDIGYSVKQTQDSGYLVIGLSESNVNPIKSIILLKTDESGNLLWTKEYSNNFTWSSCIGFDVCQTTDSGYILSGYNGNSALLIKTTSFGDILWTKSYSHINSYYSSTSLQITKDGGYVFAFTTWGGVQSDILVVKTDSLGNSGCQEFPSLLVYNTPATMDSVSLISNVSGINTRPGITLLDSGGIITMNCFAVGLEEISQNESLSIYPNPISNNNLHIDYLLPQNKSATFLIYDVTGKVVFKYNLQQWSNEQNFILPELNNGVYNCVITSRGYMVSNRLAVIK